VWDYDSGDLERTLKGHTNSVQDIVFDPSGNTLGTVRARSLSLSLSLACVQSTDSSLPRRGSFLLCRHDDQAVEYANLRVLQDAERPRPQRLVGDLHTAGRLLDLVLARQDHQVLGDCHWVRCWRWCYCVAACRKLMRARPCSYCTKTLEGHEEWVRKVIINDEANLLASCSNDQTVRLWNPASGECTGVLRGHTHVVECVAFSPSSVVPLGDEAVRIASTTIALTLALVLTHCLLTHCTHTHTHRPTRRSEKELRRRVSILLQAHATRPSSSGTCRRNNALRPWWVTTTGCEASSSTPTASISSAPRTTSRSASGTSKNSEPSRRSRMRTRTLWHAAPSRPRQPEWPRVRSTSRSRSGLADKRSLRYIHRPTIICRNHRLVLPTAPSILLLCY